MLVVWSACGRSVAFEGDQELGRSEFVAPGEEEEGLGYAEGCGC